MSSTGATLSGSFAGATGRIYETGFYYGKTSGNLTLKATTDGSNDASGNFQYSLTSLEAGTTYYYKAYVLEWDDSASTYEERFGAECSFTTSAAAPVVTPSGWLALPSYSASSMSGTTTSSLSDLYPLRHFATMGGKSQRNYSCLYDPEMFASYWVAYPLCSDHITGSGRSNQWAFDPDVPSSKQTNLTKGAYGVNLETPNYASNLYSRGHQIANADRNGVDDMCDQTFYMTNITPQIENGFNSGVWSNLETAVRNLTSSCDTVYVVTGAAFRKKTVGTESVTTIVNSRDGKTIPVPNYYWKALLKVKRSAGTVTSASAVGFWLPHQDLKGADYRDYAVSIDQIEAWTGFDLFSNLSSALQTSSETNTNWTTFQSF